MDKTCRFFQELNSRKNNLKPTFLQKTLSVKHQTLNLQFLRKMIFV
jgi:hypothetical protein